MEKINLIDLQKRKLEKCCQWGRSVNVWLISKVVFPQKVYAMYKQSKFEKKTKA